MEDVIFKCSTPIPTHGGVLSELILKPIKMALLVKHGYPQIETLEGVGKDRKLTISVNWPSVIKITADCCDVVDSLVLEQNLPAADGMDLYNTIMGMLSPIPKKTGTA